MNYKILMLFIITILNINDSFSQTYATGLESFSTMGKQSEILQSGNEELLYEKKGKGLLHHMWFGGGFSGIENTVILIYVGGSKEAVFLSSGLEDYFLGTYYFESGLFANDLAGLTYFDKKKSKICWI